MSLEHTRPFGLKLGAEDQKDFEYGRHGNARPFR